MDEDLLRVVRGTILEGSFERFNFIKQEQNAQKEVRYVSSVCLRVDEPLFFFFFFLFNYYLL